MVVSTVSFHGTIWAAAVANPHNNAAIARRIGCSGVVMAADGWELTRRLIYLVHCVRLSHGHEGVASEAEREGHPGSGDHVSLYVRTVPALLLGEGPAAVVYTALLTR